MRNNAAIGVLVNDVHLDKGNGSLVKDIFRQAVETCRKYSTDRIFCGGDTFTNRSGQPLTCLTDWKEILQDLNKGGIKVYAIAGNHDKTDAESERSYLEIFSESNFRLYKTHFYDVFDGCLVGFIPYFKDKRWLEEFRALEKEINGHGVKILITHVAVEGVRNNDGSEVESELKPALFWQWDKVLVGHYHNASVLAGGKVVYTGSAYQANYGEDVTGKGFTVIYADGRTEHVQSQFPRYIREVIDARDKETLRNLLDKYEGENVNHIRFVFQGTRADCSRINVAEIQGRYGIDVKFQSLEEREAREVAEADGILEYTHSSLRKDFIKFCAENEIRGKQLKYGLSLFNKA